MVGGVYGRGLDISGHLHWKPKSDSGWDFGYGWPTNVGFEFYVLAG